MNVEYLPSYLLLLSASPAIAFMIHFIFARLVQLFKLAIAPLAVALLAVLTGYVVVAMGAWVFIFRDLPVKESLTVDFIYGFLVYGGLSFAYFQFFGMTETARRIRILRDLFERGGVSRQEFQKRYGADAMFFVRLERLSAWKQIELKDGRYVLISRKLHFIALLIAFWADVLGFSKNPAQ